MAQTGLITMAFGAPRYIAQAEALARSLRRHMPGMRIGLVTDKPRQDDLFDDVVLMDPYGIPGTLLKTKIYDYSPYDETLFIDSDCLAVRGFDAHIQNMRAWDFTPVCNSYLRHGDHDLWLRDVGAALDRAGGESFPKFNGGVYFFRKSDHAAEVFARAAEILKERDAYGVLDFDSAGPGEETLIGLALAQMRAGPLYDDAFDLMRTPLNSTGPLVVDPIAGVSGFMKNGRKITPAIVHFCGPYAHHPSYLVARRALERDGPLPRMEAASIRLKWQWNRFRKKLSVAG